MAGAELSTVQQSSVVQSSSDQPAQCTDLSDWLVHNVLVTWASLHA